MDAGEARPLSARRRTRAAGRVCAARRKRADVSRVPQGASDAAEISAAECETQKSTALNFCFPFFISIKRRQSQRRMWFPGFGVFFFCFGALSAPELFSADCTFLPPLRFLKNSTFPFDALTPSGHFAGRAGAPPFLLLQKRRQKSRLKGALRPLENPLACGRARVPSAQPREGRAELLAACAAGASALDLLRRCRFVRLLALSMRVRA